MCLKTKILSIKMEVIIDPKSGFCFGVNKAIGLAEEELSRKGSLFCLGDIVHNEQEVERLANLGLKVISRDDFFMLQNCTVLLRAHGEPPEVFKYAQKNKINLIDGTCPVVTKLQQKVKLSHDLLPKEGTLVIFGKPNHPEVVGLNGQIDYKAHVVQNKEDLLSIDYSKPLVLYSQTTMSREKYWELKMEIEERIHSPELLDAYDTICGQVANRAPWLKKFSKGVDILVFVGGRKSSNSQVLFAHCKAANANSFFITNPDETEKISFENINRIGVCGATSTPRWLLEQVANAIKNRANG
jgi:4-hydroxy-3-methylbut-2-enyl diphosphate reductase